jgi:L-serine deaminase
VAGALIGNRALRIIRIDGFRVEAVPEGYFILCRNTDVPGVVGAVGTLLGRANVNIAGLALGRDRSGGMAINLVQIDGPVSASVLDDLRAVPAISSATLIRL